MPRIAWLTDVHLNFLEPPARARFYDAVNRTEADAVWLSGDIAESPQLLPLLSELEAKLRAPLWFVLGNHDYYFGSIAQVRADVAALCQRLPRLTYLTTTGVVEAAPGVALVGHDGWADARLGDYERSMIMMNDYKLIAELARVDKAERWPLLRRLGDESAAAARHNLEAALARYERVFLVTHVPPFAESCVYDGRPSSGEWLPHFSCWAMGQMLRSVMAAHPTQTLTVLCGHTHGQAKFLPLPNLVVYTGGAQYSAPAVQRVWNLG